MRISTVCGLGTAAALVCLALAEWAGWPLWPAVLVVALTGLLLFFQLRALEKGAALLPYRDVFARYAAVCRFAAVRRLLGGIGDYVDSLQHQYSTSVEDIDSRMGSLQSQINPHFLYNTLECIRSEALIEGCASIAKMSKAMGLFFRYSISQKENIVTIQGELDNIRNYCIIQNYRFEDKFIFKIEMEDEDDELLDCLIPKMTLQPLVENAIFHGLEPKAGQGEVKLWVTATENRVVLTVSDNGIGMDEEQLAALRLRIETPPAPSERGRGNGVALYNVNQRLRLAFGDAFGLQVYSTPGTGTDIEVVLPMLRDRSALPV